MTINLETSIRWMNDRIGKVTYSMDYRNGPNSYDCSSAVYYALMAGGAISAGWAVNTEYEHDWLIRNGYKLICENGRFEAQRGDVFIWGRRGQSSGAGGHTGIFVDGNRIIHCNYARNGITIDGYLDTARASGNMYYYIYRYQGAPSNTSKSLDQLVQETLAGVHGNGDTRKASLGSQYEAVMAVINGKASASKKSDEELAREVLAGKHGAGEDRKRSLGPRYEPVQAKVNELLKAKEKPSEVVKNEPQTVQFKEDGDLSFNGAVLKKDVLEKILGNCKKHDILPSYALTILHYEGLWGTSAVGKADNNWGGMTWTGQGNRPSGVVVTQGLARPSNEGGHYMHYTSVDDFLTDWFYLLRKGGPYKVSGALTFSESVKGMFQVGGAKYDYAAAGYNSYLVGATSRLKAIESENGSLTRFDATSNNVHSVDPDKISVDIEGIEVTINGVVYKLEKKPV
ncbi:peptidoglycan amidohydrolase family protein [Streptococcus suis]|uniref:peptidoglycan amidohydrolase family protein n=1 Tax=Streptococcus suis TaxID=1307 RepID=UPI0004928F6F|nr:peptidoglycan amidohydrolase family protein [Streptococcus suis]